jgi:peptidoglycan/LPS O-acetylase OafA/YrhL
VSTRVAARQEVPGSQAGRAHIHALDGVRGFAIAAVFLYHAWPDLSAAWGSGGATLNMLASAGPFGVDLFFVLSGFLITGILLDARDRPHYMRNFYVRRALRLFPVFYVYLLVVATVLPLFHRLIRTSMPDYGGPWSWYLLYFCNWKPNWGWGDPWLGHIWSLAVEEQFYLVWPAVVLLAGRRRLWLVCLAIIAGATALRCIWAAEGVPWNQIYRLTITRADTIAYGALGALALRSDAWRALAGRAAPWLIALGTAAFVGIAIYAGGPDWARRPIQTAGAAVAAVGFLGLVLYAATPRAGALHALLRRPLLGALGKYSYFIYVVHGLVIAHVYWIGEAAIKRTPALAVPIKLSLFVAVSVAVFVLAKLSFRFFESPILRLKNRFD